MTLSRDDDNLKRDKRKSPIPKGYDSIKASYEESEKHVKRKYGACLTRNGEDDKTPYGNGNNAFNRGKDTYITPIGDYQYIACACRYGGSTTLTPKGVVRKCKMTFKSDQRQVGGGDMLKNIEEKYPELKYPQNSKTKAIAGQYAYFVCISIGAK